MNIFVLSRNVRTCARMHCDQHVVKMPLETAQLLSTALHYADPEAWALLREQGRAYKPTHMNHPCAIWARECINNYLWLARLGLELCAEYSYRFSPSGAAVTAANSIIRKPEADATREKTHTSQPVLEALRIHAPALPDRRVITPFPLVIPEECKVPGDPVTSYRNFYNRYKARFARWTRREIPDWFSRYDV